MTHIEEQERRRAFSIWLRTGRLPTAPDADGIELKFNPWHDPANGRFTFVGTGRYYGRGSGGAAEGRGTGNRPVVYVDDPARSISTMEEAEAWRAEEMAKHGHKPEYRKAIEVRYQYYKREFARRLKVASTPIPEADGRAAVVPTPPTRRAPPSPPEGQRSNKPVPPPMLRNTVTVAGEIFPGGSGRFAGGGASGSWEAIEPSVRTMEGDLVPGAGAVSESPGAESQQLATGGRPQASSERWRTVERNGYLYEIDDQNRTRRVSGKITLNADQGRSRTAQSAAGGSDRRPSDHGGHYIARRFNGPTEAFNHFAQDANFNRSDYRALEDEWAKEKRAGKSVRVKIVPVFRGSSQRPSDINVWFWVNGKLKSQKLPNEPKGAKGAKR